MDDWARLSVDYCQYLVVTVPGLSALDIYTVGDDLLHVCGPTRLTGFGGIHTGPVQARIRVLPGPSAEPGPGPGWDAVSEATLWCPNGRLTVHGLMGGTAEALSGVVVPRGLIRVRVHARDRLHETVRTGDDPPERHELHVWAVSEETPWRTLRAEPADRTWEQKRAQAAEWAMLSLVPRPSTRPALLGGPDEDDTGLPRVAVVRHRSGPVGLPTGVLPVGDLEVRLERIDDETATWSWAAAAQPIFPRPSTVLPDEETTTVRLTAGPDGVTLRHENVLGRHAVALGLIWDHLLDEPGSHPWTAKLHAQAAAAAEQAEQVRRARAGQEAALWGGSAPSGRVRGLTGQARSLALLDRPLLDRIEALPAARQRAAAEWAARRAMRVAGLERIGWIAEALAAAEAGHPLAPSFTEEGGAAAFRRLWSDPDVPDTTVPLPGRPGRTEIPQAGAAFPALVALANEDPLAAAIEAVYSAAVAHGDGGDHFLSEAHAALGRSDRLH